MAAQSEAVRLFEAVVPELGLACACLLKRRTRVNPSWHFVIEIATPDRSRSPRLILPLLSFRERSHREGSLRTCAISKGYMHAVSIVGIPQCNFLGSRISGEEIAMSHSKRPGIVNQKTHIAAGVLDSLLP